MIGVDEDQIDRAVRETDRGRRRIIPENRDRAGVAKLAQVLPEDRFDVTLARLGIVRVVRQRAPGVDGENAGAVRAADVENRRERPSLPNAHLDYYATAHLGGEPTVD